MSSSHLVPNRNKDNNQDKEDNPSVKFSIGGDNAASPAHNAVAIELEDAHTPHHLFCEMDELRTDKDGQLEWTEAARWLKFEEDVEHGGRWSKPHVATLSLHSLLEL